MKTKDIVPFVLSFLLTLGFAFSQNTLGGMRGHLIVPDAKTFDKNSLVFGTTHYPREHLYITRNNSAARGSTDELFTYATINFIPWMDISLVVARILDPSNVRLNGIGDRSVNIKFSLLSEKERFPAIALCLEVPSGNNNFFASNCLVLSKSINKTSLTVGYGLPVVLSRKTTNASVGSQEYYGSLFALKLNDKPNNYLSGILFGISQKSTIQKITLTHTLEFDGNKLNLGENVSYSVFSLFVYTTGLNSLAYGLSGNFTIK